MKSGVGAIALLFLVVYILPLGWRPLLAPDEARYCEIPREMIKSGDWIVPRLNGLRYFEKPVLGYWAIAVSMLAFGESAFAARLPSALATGLTALLIGLIVRRSRAGPSTSVLAPAVFLTSALVFAIGGCNILDSMFVAMLTGSLAALFAYTTERSNSRRRLFLAAAGVCCGLAFLVKGFVAFVLAGCVIVPFALWERRCLELLKQAWIPILAASVVCMPWSIAIALREPDFWRHVILVQHLDRFAGSMDEQRSNPFWYLPLILLLGTYPWNMFLLSVSEGLRLRRAPRPLERFAICWIVFPLLFFSVSRGKLGTYLLPCFPPIAILTTIGLLDYFKDGRSRAFNAGILCVATVPVVCILLILIRPFARLFSADVYGDAESFPRAMGLAASIAFLAMLVLAFRSRPPLRKAALVCGGTAVALALAPLAFPLEQYQEAMPERFLRKHADLIDGSTTIVSDRALVHAVCWVFRREDVLMLDRRAGELEYGLGFAGPDRIVGIERFVDLAGSENRRGRVIVILPAAIHNTMLGFLKLVKLSRPIPVPKHEYTEGGLWIGEF